MAGLAGARCPDHTGCLHLGLGSFRSLCLSPYSDAASPSPPTLFCVCPPSLQLLKGAGWSLVVCVCTPVPPWGGRPAKTCGVRPFPCPGGRGRGPANNRFENKLFSGARKRKRETREHELSAQCRPLSFLPADDTGGVAVPLQSLACLSRFNSGT